jgi:uncharacterized repeat protein (TIGR01451 family)
MANRPALAAFGRRSLTFLWTAIFILALALQSGLTAGTVLAKSPSVVDYSQCANGKPPSTATDCPGGWINGILNANNSHYVEDDVTPQRAVMDNLTGGAAYTITLRYETRKGSAGVHAYDSLATWNYTQTGANRCTGLISCPGSTPSTYPIPADTTVMAPYASGTGATSEHQLSGQVFTLYGGTITGVSDPVHDCTAANQCGDPTVDDYADITVSFTTGASDTAIELLFGGHLAASSGPRGWGAGYGAGSISGGPYHIKWITFDGGSIGNRDNQIQASGLLPAVASTISTSATGTTTLGSSISDTATLGPSTLPGTLGGTITFDVYGPSATADCSGTNLVQELTTTVNGPGTYGSGPYTPTTAGKYWWIATYSGDVNSNVTGIAGTCGATNESSLVQGTPAIGTSAASSVTLGNAISDTATLSGVINGTSAGSIRFDLYGPSTTAVCTGTPVFTDTVNSVSADGSYPSALYTPTSAGTYWWVASYSGDVNNAPASGSCGDTGESSLVQGTPVISTTALSPVAIGTAISDTATLSGVVNGTSSGTIRFDLYGPSTTPVCTGTPVYTNTVNDVSADGPYGSGPYTPTTAGTYWWIATYSGDINNAGAAGTCGDTGESSVVGPKVPTIATQASAAEIGGSISDVATLSGASTSPVAGGSITFDLYGPSATANCSSAAIFTSIRTVTGNGSYTSDSYTPSAPGNYWWVAHYSGDVNNSGADGTCGDQGETSLITAPNLQVTKSVDKTTAVPGDVLHYTLTLSNTGNGAASGVTVTDDISALLAHATYDGDASNGGTFSSPTLSWTGLSVPASSSLALTFSVTLDQSGFPVGTTSLPNTVVVTGLANNCSAASTDPACSTTTTVTVVPLPSTPASPTPTPAKTLPNTATLTGTGGPSSGTPLLPLVLLTLAGLAIAVRFVVPAPAVAEEPRPLRGGRGGPSDPFRFRRR